MMVYTRMLLLGLYAYNQEARKSLLLVLRFFVVAFISFRFTLLFDSEYALNTQIEIKIHEIFRAVNNIVGISFSFRSLIFLQHFFYSLFSFGAAPFVHFPYRFTTHFPLLCSASHFLCVCCCQHETVKKHRFCFLFVM